MAGASACLEARNEEQMQLRSAIAEAHTEIEGLNMEQTQLRSAEHSVPP